MNKRFARALVFWTLAIFAFGFAAWKFGITDEQPGHLAALALAFTVMPLIAAMLTLLVLWHPECDIHKIPFKYHEHGPVPYDNSGDLGCPLGSYYCQQCVDEGIDIYHTCYKSNPSLLSAA